MREIYLCELCESSTGRISLYRINFYRAICVNARTHNIKPHKFIKPPIFMNLHKFVMHIKMLLYGKLFITHTYIGE